MRDEDWEEIRVAWDDDDDVPVEVYRHIKTNAICRKFNKDDDGYARNETTVQAFLGRRGVIFKRIDTMHVSDCGDDGGSIHFGPFPATMSDDEIARQVYYANGDPGGRQCHTHEGDCCGRIFIRSMWIRRGPRFAMAGQYWGRDV